MSFRHADILEMTRQEGKVTVDGLAARFNVTLQTIRRDLTELADAGRLTRVHGGAVLPSGVTNIGYEDRRRLNDDSKARIGQACAATIKNGTSLFLGIGTTAEAVARALVHHDGLLVVTNNMNAVPILTANSGCKILLTGGAVRATDMGLTGPMAVASVRQFRFDTAVIGCSALDASGSIFDFDLDEVMVSQAVIYASGRTILAADSAKFKRTAPARVCALPDISVFCTDADPAPLMCTPLPDTLKVVIAR